MKKTEFFTRPFWGSETIIASLQPANFDALVKIILIVLKITGDYWFSLIDSRYGRSLSNGSCVIWIDLKEVLGDGISLSLTGDLKSLRKIRGNDDVLFIRIDENYVVTNGFFEVTLGHKSDSRFAEVDFNDSEQIGVDIELNDELESIRAFIFKSGWVDLMIHNGQLDMVMLPNEKRYSFDRIDHNEKPELILRSYRFLPVPGKRAVLSLIRKDHHYWLRTVTTVGKDLEIYFYERLKPC